MDDYTATSERPCPECGGDTIPPTPGRDEEWGYYCEQCGRSHNIVDGRIVWGL